MEIDKNRIFIGLLLVLFFVFSYFIGLDYFILSLISIFTLFELNKCKFINSLLDYLIVILFVLLLPLIFYKPEIINILNIFFILFVILNILFPNIYLKRFFTISVFIFLYNFFYISSFNRDLFYMTVFVAFFNDTIAYIFGKSLKGPLIMPQVSPKKTWSGTVISFVLTSFLIFQFKFSILMSCLLSISLFFGDIFYSYIKRKNNLKDFSNFLKGHGGVLDRLDSMYFFLIIITFIST